LAEPAPAAQRRWRASCPNCGAPVEFASAASSTAVCGFCRSTLLRDGDVLERIGQSAEIFDDYSPLQLGATGRWMGSGFAVVGRVQRGSALGNWNEWHLLFDAGPDAERPRVGWLSEDNGRFVLSVESPFGDTPPSDPQLGLPLTLAGQRWQVAAIVEATVRAAEGELPRVPRAGRVVELRNERDEVGTLEYRDDSPPAWSVGRGVALADLALQGLRTTAEGASVAEAAFKGRSIACPNCGSPLEPRLSQTKSMVCAQCQALVDLPEGDAKALGFTAQSPGSPPLIPLGHTGTLAIDGETAQAWQVVGYQERCDLPEDAEDEQSFWREYLLFNRMAGFAFLVDTNEGWSLVRTLTGAPAAQRSGATWQGQDYVQRWVYQAKTTHVLGEFYWPVRLDDRVMVTDYASRDGSLLLSREQQGPEVTWSAGRTLPAATVQQAFGIATSTMPFTRDASAFKNSGGTLLRNIVIGLFAAVVLFSLLRACSSDDCQRYADSFGATSNEYRQCRQNAHGSGVYIPSGGSYGGYSSGGGSHK
jgi:ribosomal protein S27AE